MILFLVDCADSLPGLVPSSHTSSASQLSKGQAHRNTGMKETISKKYWNEIRDNVRQFNLDN